MTLRVGVVGCGAIAQAHLPAIAGAAGAEIAGLYDQDPARARALAARYPGIRVYDSWKDLLADESVDCVDVLLPHALHATYAVDAAAAGKHVMVEKPLATSLAEADAIIAAASRNDVALMVCHTALFEPGTRRVAEIVRSGDIGEIYMAQTLGLEGPDTPGARPWLSTSPGGGVLMAQAVHVVYLLRALIGDVRRVSAMRGKRKIAQMQNEDTCLALLEFDSGAVAEITSTFGQTVGPYERGLYLYGSSGYVAYRLGSRGSDSFRTIEVFSETRFGDREPHLVPLKRPDEPESQFQIMWEEFAAAMEQGREPPVTGADGRAAIEIVLAAYQAADSGTTVEIPRARG